MRRLTRLDPAVDYFNTVTAGAHSSSIFGTLSQAEEGACVSLYIRKEYPPAVFDKISVQSDISIDIQPTITIAFTSIRVY